MSAGPALRYPVNALVSYHYFPKPEVTARLHAGGLRVIGDSGAYSASTLGKPIAMEDFARWCNAVWPHTCWVASLDVIGNPAASFTNWQELRRRGLDVVPTVHYGSDPRTVDRYVDRGVDFIGLGGMVARKSEQARIMRWALSVFRYARTVHPELRFHGWGVTHPLLVQSLPWWSVDSSGFGAAYRYGRLSLFDPTTKKTVGCQLDGRDVHRLGHLLRRHYGTDPKDIQRSSPANRPLLVKVAARSFQLLEDYLRARHNVQAPTYGVRGFLPAGTSVHAVDGSEQNLTPMTDPDAGTRVHAVSTALVDYTTLGTNVHAVIASPGWKQEATHLVQNDDSQAPDSQETA